MKAIANPINRNSQGTEVSNLQEVLLLLLRRQLIRVADEERTFYEEGLLREQREQTYNDITQRVVGIFQEESRLPITGDVDEPTAAAFNRLLKALFVVRGNVRLMDNTPVPNVTVQAFDRDLRSRELLGQTTTNINGYYEIFYTRNQFIRAEKQTADLIVVAVEPILRGMVARSRTLAESATLFNAPRIAKVNLAIAANLFQPLSEYVRLIQTLGDLLVNVTIPGNDQPTLIDKLADLKEDDLDFLFHETNIELEKLQFLTQSARLQEQFSQQDFSVPLPAFYGLARTKGLNDLAGFARSSTEELRAGLIQAGGLPSQPQQNIIAPFESEDQLNQMVEIIHSVAINQVLTNPIGENQASLSQVLAIALPSVPHQQALLQTYANHDGTIEQFWDNLRQQETFQETGQVERIQFALQLNTLTQSNLSLVDALQTQFQSTRSLAQMNPAELTTLIKQLAPTVSPDFPGDTPEEKLNLYSNSIVGLLQGAFPTESIAQVVSTVADVHLNRVAPDQISQFLNRATDRAILATEEVFDIRSTQIDRFLELHGDRVFADIDGDRPQITQQVKRVQRLFQVSTSPESFKILMESGFNSANEIAQQSFRTMQENLGQQIPPEELALIHQRAIATSAASLQTALLAYQSATDISPAAIGGGLKELPNWANLFGSLELCECQHCRSLYSPAAYFVDLLEFLRNAPPNAQGWTPLDVLVGNDDNPNRVFPGKRPDLPHILLTCENTNTPIPYIDLVNEVLESYVAFGQLSPTTAKDTGLSTAPELSANPQYVEEGAYHRLREAVFPTSLPFDRSLEMARLYLDHLGSSRHEVLKAFEVDSNQLTSEALGLSEKEFEILTGQDFQGVTTISLSQLYSYANEELTPRLEFDPIQNTVGELITSVPEFLQQMELSYLELVDLLKTRFINSHQRSLTLADKFLKNAELTNQEIRLLIQNNFVSSTPAIESKLIKAEITLAQIQALIEPLRSTVIVLYAEKSECELDKTLIQYLDGSPLTEMDTWKLQRFIRLWRKLGWTMAELDSVLFSFGYSDTIPPEALQKLSQIQQIQIELNLTLPKLLSFWGNIETQGEKPLYQILFQNKAVFNPPDPYFLLNDAQNELVDASNDPENQQHLADKQPALLAALRLKYSELEAIIRDAQLIDPYLNLTNLSAVYRYGALAKALRMPVQDLIALKKLAGRDFDPFTPGDPAPTLKFIHLIQTIQSSGFLVPQLDYLFRHKVVLPSKFPPQQPSVSALLKTLQDGLKAIAEKNQVLSLAENELPPNPLETGISRDFIDKRTYIQQTLSQALNLEDEIVKHLLTNPNILQANTGANQNVLVDFLSLENLPTNPVWPDDTLASYERLHKIAMLVNLFDFSATEVEYWFSSDFRGFLLNNLPITAIAEPILFEEWKQLADYVLLRDSLPPGVSNLIDVFKAEDDQKSDRLANLTNWRKEEIENAIAGLGYQNSDLSSIPHLLKIQQIIALSKKIGVSINKLQNWAIAVPNSEQAKEIKNAVKAKYNETAWLEISKPLSDKLREKQKSALIAYVLSMPQIRAANVMDSNRLFEYFLIDVEMCACMNTSRIKQGISSVQLFVQRCLLNLEPAVRPRAIDSDRWQWTKNYRVWEANRKVFLYPENWIEPELRDDKSPFFKELESELLQTDITNEAAEKALLNYLYKLDQVARLEVCGMYLQEETDGQDKSILHVFARTMGGAVRSYFYRRLLNNKEWTPWEKVELDINGVQGSDKTEEDGIHLLPVVWNRRLYLFWLVFTQKAEQIKSNSNVKPQDGISINIPKKYWEITLAWSKYEQNKWLPKQISKQPLVDSIPKPLPDLRKLFRLKALQDNQNNLELHLLFNEYTPHPSEPALGSISEKKILFSFYFDEYSGIKPSSKEGKLKFDLDQKSDFYFMSYENKSGLSIDIPNSILSEKVKTISMKFLDHRFSSTILPLNQYYRSPLISPYFYQDNQHIYFVRSRENYEAIVKQVANPQKTSPFLEKELELQFQGRLPLPKVNERLEKSVANPWVLAEQQLVAQKLTTSATRSGSTFSP